MNPFHPFLLARDQNFLNRIDEERNVLENINKGISTAIIGNPHIGKTSLLKKIAKHEQFTKTPRIASAWLEIGLFTETDTPAKFWQRVCEKAIASQPKITRSLKIFANHAKYNPSALFESFEKLGAKENRVIVFIDEFDKILDRPHLKTPDFIDSLHTFTQKTRGLCLVIASRKSIPELQEAIPVSGSPFEAISLALKSFNDATVQELFVDSGLVPDAVEEAKLLGGHHPFLLHLAGDLLWEVKDKPVKQWYPQRDIFVDKATPHFNDVWKYLSPKAQLVVILAALQKLEGKIGGASFNIKDADKILLWLTKEVYALGNRAVLEQDENGKWTIGSIGFLFWLIENKIADAMTQDLPTFDKWLHDKQFKLAGLMTEEEIQFTQKVLKSIPADITSLAKKAFLPKYLQ